MTYSVSFMVSWHDNGACVSFRSFAKAETERLALIAAGCVYVSSVS